MNVYKFPGRHLSVKRNKILPDNLAAVLNGRGRECCSAKGGGVMQVRQEGEEVGGCVVD